MKVFMAFSTVWPAILFLWCAVQVTIALERNRCGPVGYVAAQVGLSWGMAMELWLAFDRFSAAFWR